MTEDQVGWLLATESKPGLTIDGEHIDADEAAELFAFEYLLPSGDAIELPMDVWLRQRKGDRRLLART